MGFRIYMAVIMLLIPAAMIVIGHFWRKHPPKQINSTYGYRTRRSMFSKRTWDYAHTCCSKIWRKLGWFTFAVTIIIVVIMLCVHLDTESAGSLAIIVVFLQMILMVLALPATERALKHKFGI